jgi:hypothetical protein
MTVAAGDPFPTDDRIAVPVHEQFAADFLTNWMTKPLGQRPVLRMMLHDDDAMVADLGGWQVVAVNTVRRDAGYDVVEATLRKVFD